MMPDDTDLREQLEITKEFLEQSHGRAVRYDKPEQARAYYEALEDIETALEGGWDPENAGNISTDHLQELVDESRAAREEGFEAATLREQRREKRREKYPEPTLLDRLLDRLLALGD